MNWKLIASHIGVLALGFVLGYEFPALTHAYRQRAVLGQIESQIKQDPKNADNWASLGVSKASEGDSGGATAAYQKALGLDPSNVTALVGMGNIYYKRGNFSAAEKWYSDALTAAKKHNNASEIATAQELLQYAQTKERAQSK